VARQVSVGIGNQKLDTRCPTPDPRRSSWIATRFRAIARGRDPNPPDPDPERAAVLSLWRALVAFVIVAVVCVLALRGLVSLFLEVRARRRARVAGQVPPAVSRSRVWARRVVLALALVGLLCGAYAHWVEPDWLAVERVSLPLRGIPPGAPPVRLALLSDTHSEPEAHLERELPTVLAGLAPDLIVFAGDSLNEPGGLPVFRELLTELAKLAPTYVVRGNWDVWYFGGLDLFGGTGAIELTDEGARRLDVRGVELWLAGFAVQEGWEARALEANEPRVAALLDSAPQGSVRVFVHHYPELAELAARHGAGLVLSGDTHGGQVRLPLLGELVRLSRFGGYELAGLHRFGEAFLYVNRGLGVEGGAAPRVRFLCRPELTLLELTPGPT
jgi:uncharacterized protein